MKTEPKKLQIRLGGHEEPFSTSVDNHTTVADLVREITASGKLGAGPVHLFEEDGAEELPGDRPVSADKHGLNASRCRRVKVTFYHVDDTRTEDFPPGNTIAHLIQWCRKAFNVDAGAKYALRLQRDSEPLPQAAHVGNYVPAGTCSLTLYFTPAVKVLG